jgi:osmotically-inducible protein OsmY
MAEKSWRRNSQETLRGTWSTAAAFCLLRRQNSWLALIVIALVFGVSTAALEAQSLAVAEIQNHLKHVNVFKHGEVHVTFADSVATLSGTVDSIGVKMDAQNAALRDEDVVRVVNDIRVSDAGISPKEILEQAHHRLLSCYAYTIYDNVEVAVRENTLVVNGEVTQPYKKEAIAYNLSHIKGVVALENHLTVLPLSTYNEDLRARVARAIYDDPYFADYVDAGRLPIHILATDAGVTLVGVVDSQADRTRAEGDARLAASSTDAIVDYLEVVGPSR